MRRACDRCDCALCTRGIERDNSVRSGGGWRGRENPYFFFRTGSVRRRAPVTRVHRRCTSCFFFFFFVTPRPPPSVRTHRVSFGSRGGWGEGNRCLGVRLRVPRGPDRTWTIIRSFRPKRVRRDARATPLPPRFVDRSRGTFTDFPRRRRDGVRTPPAVNRPFAPITDCDAT